MNLNCIQIHHVNNFHRCNLNMTFIASKLHVTAQHTGSNAAEVQKPVHEYFNYLLMFETGENL
jgi:hypothetical protein